MVLVFALFDVDAFVLLLSLLLLLLLPSLLLLLLLLPLLLLLLLLLLLRIPSEWGGDHESYNLFRPYNIKALRGRSGVCAFYNTNQ